MQRPKVPGWDELLRTVLASANVRVSVIDKEGRFVLEPDPNAHFPGERATPVGASAVEMYADFPEALAKLGRALKGERERFSMEAFGGNLEVELVPWSAASGGEIDYVIGIGSFVTGQKTAERALAVSRSRERRIFDSAMVGMVVWDENGAITDANDTLLKMLGYSRDDLRSGRLDWMALTPPEFLAFDTAALTEIRERGACTPFEKEYVRQDGTRIPVLLGGASWEPGGHSGVAFVIELTDRKRHERAQRESEERLQRIMESAPIVLWSVDKDGIFTLSAGRALAHLGLRPGEVVGRSAFEMYREVPVIVDAIKRCLTGEEFSIVVETAGRVFETSYTPLRDDGRTVTGVLGISIDITERHTAEREQELLRAQLLQVQKLESLGILAGGIAHDFNNILTSIWGSASVALMTIPPGNAARSDIENIVAAGRRATTLTRQMLAYSGKGHFEVRVVDLSEHVREIAQLLETTVPKKVHLRLDLATNLPAIEVDVAQLQQVVMNLVLNGAEAIGDDSGSVLVATGVQEIDSDFSASLFSGEGLAPGRYVFVEVYDTGRGMDEATQAKIFDPFFTTKFAGRGLGLAAVLGIVRAHKGAIKVDSTPGKGSTFKVFFPASPSAAAKRSSEGPQLSYRGRGLVLVIDDDEGARQTFRRMLEYVGFTVEEAVDGSEGCAMFTSRPGQFALVVVDMTMPKMSGEETFREIRRTDERVPVILTSGYNEVEATRRFTAKGLAGFLEKPFTADSLARKLQAILPAG